MTQVLNHARHELLSRRASRNAFLWLRSSVIVQIVNINRVGTIVGPCERQAPIFIDPYRVAPFVLAFEAIGNSSRSRLQLFEGRPF